MKLVLLLIITTWGPYYPTIPATAAVFKYDLKTEKSCIEVLDKLKYKNGEIENLKGYYQVTSAFCGDVEEGWPPYNKKGK